MSKPQTMKCPNCGKPMRIGKIFGNGVLAGGKTNIVWVDETQGWGERERLDSELRPKGFRAHRCKECGLIIPHERRNKS